MITDPGPVRRYIEDRLDTELSAWDILFASTGGGDGTMVDESLGVTINCQRRMAGDASDALTLRITNKQRVASRGVEKTGLTPAETTAAESRYRDEREAQGRPMGDRANYPDLCYRKVRTRPLLIVHLLKIDPGGTAEEAKRPVVAYGISFPKPVKEEKRVEYIVDKVWLRENFAEDFEDDELSGDEDKGQ